MTIKKEKILQKFIDENYPNLLTFSNIHSISYSTLHAIYTGRRLPKRPLALKLVAASDGKMTMKDFGFD